MNIGEAITGFGTILLAFVTAMLAGITYVGIREDRIVRQQNVEREHKIRLSDKIQDWLTEVRGTIIDASYDPDNWASPGRYFEVKARSLKQLLHLSDLGFYYLLQGRKTFEKHDFEKKTRRFLDSFGKCTDLLHDLGDVTTSGTR